MLEKEQASLIKMVSQEQKKARKFAREKNKRVALQCLKKKKLYVQQLKQLENFILQITKQMIMLRGAKVCTKTADALGTGAAAAKKLRKAANIYAVMDVVNKEIKSMGRMQEAIQAPSGADSGADSDEDLEAGTESPFPSSVLDQEDELADLQTEMAS